MLNGETDDGNAWYANGGVAGHAGLFSTASDLHALLDLLLAHGRAGGHQYIRSEVVDRFLTLDRYQNYLGWMAPNGMPIGSFNHTGFTGTYVLGVPKYGLSIVLLTNRQNMGTDARGYFPDVGPLQSAVARAIVAAAETDSARLHGELPARGDRVRVVAPSCGTVFIAGSAACAMRGSNAVPRSRPP
jgi:CubicO group peptidase (beta-lactamase class C family)